MSEPDIIVIETVDGKYEDQVVDIVWAGMDLGKALEKAATIGTECTSLYRWRDGVLVSLYSRDYEKPDGLGRGGSHGHWERNSGEPWPLLERSGQHIVLTCREGYTEFRTSGGDMGSEPRSPEATRKVLEGLFPGSTYETLKGD